MNNKRYLKKWLFFGIIFILIIGTLSHFIYEWTNYNKIIGIFVAVNESVWEHIKLAIFSVILLTIIKYSFLKIYDNFIAGIFISLITMILLIPIIFYSYKFILGNNYLILDILDFIISVTVGEYLFYKILSLNKSLKDHNIYFIIGLFLIAICYLTFTYFPLKIGLFEDPIKHTYGINMLDK